VRQPKSRWSFGLSSIVVIVLLASASALVLPRLHERLSGSQPAIEGLATTVVRRTDMDVTLTTGGRVDSSEKTLIECELERLELSVKGQAMVGGGASTVLSVIPDGTDVKKGEILCQLDASEYEEMLRQQRMTVKRALADHRQAELDLEVAKLAVVEFRDGTLQEALKDLAGQIALAETTLQRAGDRLKWTRRMLEKGYAPFSQLTGDKINALRAEFQLQQSRGSLEVFQKYSVPRTLRELDGAVQAAQVTLDYQDRRLQRHLEREAMLKLQLERCTIRAPHDGFLIYAINDERPVQIEEGMVVRQRQDLFYLPNLTKMVAKAMVHESVAQRVQPGMLARIRVEGLPGRLVEGHVASIAQLPTQNTWNEVTYFYTEIVLDTIPRGLKPGMTAEIEIATNHRSEVLAIPIEALAITEGRDYCYVVRDNSIERRSIEIGQATSGMLEVTAGLEEGERVVLDPDQFDHGLDTLSPFNPEFESLAAEVYRP
jgi:HlyD family secretion protein